MARNYHMAVTVNIPSDIRVFSTTSIFRS